MLSGNKEMKLNDNGVPIMPWGEHKDEPFDEIPSGYLRWLARECDDDEIREAAEEEIQRRDDEQGHFE